MRAASFAASGGFAAAGGAAGQPYAMPGFGGDAFQSVGSGCGMSVGGGSRGSRPPKIFPQQLEDDDASYTTVMLRNIPNKYTQAMLVEQLHSVGFKGDIDYVYLPIDFANRCNCGYCFLNFRTHVARQRFLTQFQGVAVQSCLPGFNSFKVCQVTCAKWQGREENVRQLRRGPELMAQLAAHPDWLPMLLDESGNQEIFQVDVAAAQGPVSFPRRSGKKGGQAEGMLSPAAGGPVYRGGGKGQGRGGGGRGGRGGGRGQGGGDEDFTASGPCDLPFGHMGYYGGMMAAMGLQDSGFQYYADSGFPPGAHVGSQYEGGYAMSPYHGGCSPGQWFSQDDGAMWGAYDMAGGYNQQLPRQQQRQRRPRHHALHAQQSSQGQQSFQGPAQPPQEPVRVPDT